VASRVSSILDSNGRPMQRVNGKPRPELGAALERLNRRRKIDASYDAAQNSDDIKNYWAAADDYDADSANSREVRQTLVKRSRYEVSNNGFADGIASTWATDLIGRGPSLRMQTGSEGFNSLVENAWLYWTKAIQFRRKLWCMAHALHVDGEGLGVVRLAKTLNNPIKLDLRLYEAEHCQTPLLGYNEPGRIDGVWFDENGTPTHYDILKEHPGSSTYARTMLTPDKIPARYVIHWFKMRRPGQHRGIPQSTSTLNTGAAARRWREATLAAAETAADFTLFLKTQFQPDELDLAEPFSTLEIQKRMMTALPNAYEPFQMKSEHPNATFESFHRSLINEQARPKAMPFNKAACDSADYNYASGRLDHQTYYGSLDVEREDCNDLVLNPLFDVWFEAAVVYYGWLGGNPDVLTPAAKSHIWDWPKHAVADVKTEASANDQQLKNGSKSLSALYSDAGKDYEDEVVKQAQSNGVTPDQQRQINMLANLPQHIIPVVGAILGLPDSTAKVKPEGADNAQTEG
jgi:capsid protein